MVTNVEEIRKSRSIQRKSDEFARPANTTAYSAKDIVNAADNAIRSIVLGTEDRQGGILTKVRLMADDKALTNRFRIHFFHTSPGATATDNNLYTLLWANRANRLGFLDLPAMSTEDATGSNCSNTILANQAFSFELVDTKIYYIIETLDGFTPASGTNFYLELETTIPA